MARDYSRTTARATNPPSYLGLFLSKSGFYGILVGAAWGTLALPNTAMAVQWRVEPRLRLAETYTDNAELTAAKRSDFITDIEPGISIQGHSGKSELRFNYSLQSRVYARDSSLNQLNHFLSADGRTVLIPDWLFFEATANVSQQNVSLLGPIGISLADDRRNTTEVRSYSVSPFIRDNFGSTFSYEARYQHDYVSSENDLLGTSEADKVFLTLRSGTAFNRFGWGLNYFKEVVTYRFSQDTSAESVSADFRYAINPRLAVIATTGYEKNDFVVLGPSPEGRFWNAGIIWHPSNLTTLRATGGERFFGRTYAFNFDHRSRLFLWSASYGESINTTRSNLQIPVSVDTFSFLDALVSSQISDPIARAQFVNNFIIARNLPATLSSTANFFTNQTFLEKRANGTVSFSTAKTTSAANIFRVDRSAAAVGGVSTVFSTDNFVNSANLTQTGGSLLFNWRFAPKTAADFGVGSTRTKFRESSRSEDLKYIRVGLRHQLRPRVTSSLDYRHVRRDSNDGSGNYNENAISAAIYIRF